MHISLKGEKSASNWVLCSLHHAFAPIFIPSVLRVCSPLLTKTVSGSPLFTNSLAWHAGFHEVCPQPPSPPMSPSSSFQVPSALTYWGAHHSLMTQDAFSCHDQKPELTSRERQYVLSCNRDSGDWVGCRDDCLSSSVMSSRTPPLYALPFLPLDSSLGQRLNWPQMATSWRERCAVFPVIFFLR